MNEDSPNGSLYGTLAKHDQSETKCDNVAMYISRSSSNMVSSCPQAF
jgi:hypothetical protein